MALSHGTPPKLRFIHNSTFTWDTSKKKSSPSPHLILHNFTHSPPLLSWTELKGHKLHGVISVKICNRCTRCFFKHMYMSNQDCVHMAGQSIIITCLTTQITLALEGRK
ncbi:hypothetical protein YC2023_045787 [Brassica napus]